MNQINANNLMNELKVSKNHKLKSEFKTKSNHNENQKTKTNHNENQKN